MIELLFWWRNYWYKIIFLLVGFLQIFFSITFPIYYDNDLIYDRMLLITLSYWIGNVIEINIWNHWIMKHVLIKFGSLKIDNGGDTMMCSDAIYYQTTYGKLNKFSWLYIVLRTHHCISTVINFETTKFYHNLVHDSIHPNITFNRISYLIWQCYEQQQPHQNDVKQNMWHIGSH